MINYKSNKSTLVIVTTVPETLATILRGQPRWLSEYFSVICITSPGESAGKVRTHEAVPVVFVPMVRGISPVKDLVSILKMWRVLRTLKPDAVHSYTPKAGMVAMFSACLAGVNVRVHTFTGLLFPSCKGIKRKLLVTIDKLVCAAATRVVPEGEGVANDLRNWKITNKPLQVIGNGNISGVDTTYFHPDFSVLYRRFPVDSFVFCFVGRLNRDKGLQELVSAFLALPDRAILLLTGEVDMSAPVDEETLVLIRSHPRIVTTGFLDDIRPVLASSKVLVLPSYREGFPNVILQAGAMAKPVIATDINGCNEVIMHEFNGWLVPPRDSTSLAKQMSEVMGLGENHIHNVGKCARSRIEEKYEQQAYRTMLLEFYREEMFETNF